MEIIFFSLLASFVVSIIICGTWTKWFIDQQLKWLENFFDEEYERKKEFMEDFINRYGNR